jgi:hypothetical protein
MDEDLYFVVPFIVPFLRRYEAVVMGSSNDEINNLQGTNQRNERLQRLAPTPGRSTRTSIPSLIDSLSIRLNRLELAKTAYLLRTTGSPTLLNSRTFGVFSALPLSMIFLALCVIHD